ncbi:MAG: bifunctional phosphopantothenoylcysteine decarboxylase/phosphopantothenate--cysteine ligase CoaBC [Bacteroidetes bacterium]|nr:bifunctional phosphopantothenoylcysteine decarboxylase/phosphopantothenate--cysteine ligase CoaBC [Bacteroidota bacterium]
MRLSGKRIILGITGSIAAYKSAPLCRLLKGEGADVQVITTRSAEDFVSPLTLSVLSGKPVLSEMISEENTWNNHIELGIWADLLLIAPLSAHTLSAFVTGTCENLLQAVYLSARCPVFVAPAMDHDMYLHPATTQNLDVIKHRGNTIIGPAYGELASGLIGEGRMEEPEVILEKVISFFSANKPLVGKSIIVTAGPTQEAIDPVRFITNHSSGKMGIAIAKSLLEMGAQVKLIAGPVQEKIPDGLIHIPVISADDMLQACVQHFPTSDAAIMTAAVADYRPSTFSDKKVKKSTDDLQLPLSKTVDIAATLGKMKTKNQFLVGFALETNDEMANAEKKLISKNLDFIVLNSLNDKGAGFGTDTNKVTLIFKGNKNIDLPLMSKSKVASNIVESLVNLMHA